MCAPALYLLALVARRGRAVFLAQPRRADGVFCLFVCVRSSAAGATWRLVTASAPWAARSAHTTVIDAAGAIYVIGGYNYASTPSTNFNDVWVSADGGADRTPAGTGVGRRYSLVLPGYFGVLRGTLGVITGTQLVQARY